MADRIGRKTVECRGTKHDRYGRLIAVCYLGTEDLNAWLVSEGWALAYRKYSLDCIRAEDSARSKKRGVWQGDFIPPWEWRAERRKKSS